MGLAGRESLPARLLSEGQRRRVALARLLVCNTKLWLLDEVMTSLDKGAVALVRSLIENHLTGGGIAIVATHQELELSAAGPNDSNSQRERTFELIDVALDRLARSDAGVASPRRHAVDSFLLCDRRQSVSARHRTRDAVAANDRAGRSLGSSTAGVDAFARAVFANDYQDGTLEQLLLTPQPLFLVVLGKTLAHWIVAEVPLVLIAPLVGVQFDLSRETLWILFASLLLGTPVLSLIGSVGAALTLGLRGGGVLISILVLPLYIPALIFGAGAVEASIMGTSPARTICYLLGAFAIVSLLFSPWAAALAAFAGISLEWSLVQSPSKIMNVYKYASPTMFYPLAGKMIPWFAIPAAILFAVGMFVGFFIAPTDSNRATHTGSSLFTCRRRGWECCFTC